MKLLIYIFLATGMLCSQSSNSRFNPNISVVGDLRLSYDKVLERPVFSFGGLELVIENYLNPFSRADMTVHLSDDEKVDIEEAYVTILKGLPLNSQIRFGRYFLPFGQIQTKHTHILPYFDYPELHEAYFGDEGVRNLGLEVNFAFPIFNQFTELKLNLLEGHITAEDESLESSKSPNLAYGVNYSVFTELGDFTHLSTSFSYLSGSNDIAKKEKVDLYAFAAKFKWKASDYNFFQITAEIYLNDRNVLLPSSLFERVKNSGYFVSANYQFNKHYNFGSYYNVFQNPISDTETKAMAAFAGFAPMEESFLLRLKYGYNFTEKADKIELQLIFSLGPHKTHKF